MRLGLDLSILRHPTGGTRRYADELARAMAISDERGEDELITLAGLRRWRAEGPVVASARRAANFAGDLAWLTVGAAWNAASRRLDAWLGPANVLPLSVPRPMVVTIHDLNFLVRPAEYDPAFARYARFMYRTAASRATRVITSSEASRAMVIEELGADPETTVTVYPGIDHVTAAQRPSNELPGDAGTVDGPYALYVGQTEPHKNIGLLLDAWARDVPANLALVICGPRGRDEDRLQVLVAQRQIRDRVRLLGEVDDRRLESLYRRARMFLFPSLSEGFGFPPLEAMSGGIPTAVATSGSLPEITLNGALHFDPNDAEALVDIVTRLHDDETLRQRLMREGRRVAGTYRWADTAVQVWREVRLAHGR